MAGKGRRAAARQGELSRRRKRNQRGPSGIPAAQTEQQNGGVTAVATDDAENSAVATQPEPQAATPAPAVARQPAPAPTAQRPQGRLRGERPAAYNYVGAELRRIGLLSTVVVAALIVLSIVL